jgi:hypothetical protein
MSERGMWEPDAAEKLELLAIAEQFAAEHAAGANPRLAEYLQRYPRHAAELTAFVAALLADAAPDDSSTETGETVHRAALSAGTVRALAHIFPGATHAEPQAAVAETRAAYAPGGSDETARPGLLSLARERGLTPETLAHALHLSPALVRWLDAGGIVGERAPEPLVERLAAALDLPHEQTIAALGALRADDAPAAGAPARSALREAVIGDASISKAHLREWLALLDVNA